MGSLAELAVVWCKALTGIASRSIGPRMGFLGEWHLLPLGIKIPRPCQTSNFSSSL